MQQLPDALAPLRAYRQFVAYKAVPSRRRPGKHDKFPVSLLTGEVVDAHDAQHWGTVDQAIACAQHWGEGFGIAFVFTADDPFFFIDIDDAVVGGNWSPTAQDLLARFAGAAVEVSHSGTGLHIIGAYGGAEPDHRCKNIPLKIELYTSGRFVALTGNQALGAANIDHSAALAAAIGHYWPVGDGAVDGPVDFEWTDGPVEGACPIEDDDKLIEKALGTTTAASAFGGQRRAAFADLWHGNAEALAVTYPDDGGRAYDASSADAALAQHLAFWTGKDCARIERLMRRSGLVRDKWDKHRSYLRMTIAGACRQQTNVYSVGAPVKVVARDAADSGPVMREGYQLMSPSQQMEHFAGCVYVAELDKIFTPNGSLMRASQFNAMYGGYAFTMDAEGDKTTRKAWEAFTESQVLTFPKVDAFCFRPSLDPGQIVTEEGHRYVNTYVPVDIPMEPGDVTPFLEHLRKVLPDEGDQMILLAYMAACVQYKGYKIQWAPLLQGCEGNGKTLFTRCVAYALGKRYVHFPKASKIDSEFNGWLLNKLFIGVEDIYVPDNRREILETLKPMITGGDGLEIQFKGVDQVTRDVCANFMLNSNHKDAVKKTVNDRRYCVFYTAQQEAEDLRKWGMTGDYFPNLYDWLRDGGYAKVAHFLSTFDIPEHLDPTGECQRAPTTTSTREAVIMGMGPVEQEILEAIDEERPGFAGGWVSSFAVDKLLDDMRKRQSVPRTKRRELMRSIGYDYHPHLNNGRVNSVIAMEGGKPRLFIRDGHIHANLTNPSEIIHQYCRAQGGGFGVDTAVNS